MEFRHEVIDDSPPCGRLGICLPTDLTGNGRPDIIVGGLGATELPLIGTDGIPIVGRLLRRLEKSIFWYENPGWERHAISTTHDLYVFGNALGDVTGNGRVDLFVGQGTGQHDVYWFEQPSDPRRPWERHLIGSPFDKYHDLVFADVDNDGEPELVGTSQESEVVFYYDVPPDPRKSPWPKSCLHVVAEEMSVEGLAVVDVDGDGDNELVAGTDLYQQSSSDPNDTGDERLVTDGSESRVADGWMREPIATGWDWTRVAVGDLDDDGDPELVFAEGDSPTYGDGMAKVAWFDPTNWTAHVLRDDMFCPHSVQVADFDGNGHLDIYVGEMGLGENPEPEHVVFRNRGGGDFEEQVLNQDIATHEAKAVDVDGDGNVDIVGKSYEPDAHVDVWYNATDK